MIRDPTEAEWQAILRYVNKVDAQATSQRRPDLLKEIYSPECFCLGGKTKVIEDKIIGKGLRAVGLDDHVVSAMRLPNEGDAVRFLVVHDVAPYDIVDDSGKQIGRTEAVSGDTFEEDFRWFARQGKWLVTSIHHRGTATDVIPGWTQASASR